VVSKSARRRQLARESYERYQARRAEKERRTRHRQRLLLLGTTAVVVLALVAWGVWWFLDVDEDDVTTASDPSSTPSASAAPGPCEFTPGGTPARPVDGVPPADPGDLSGTWTATFTINGQPVTASLDAAGAPCAVTSLQFLADRGYYTDTVCHRVTTAATFKVLQCGDAAGTGSGSPGYSFPSEVSGDETYPRGTLAMANAGGQNGSQFFIVYGDTQLGPEYTVLGSITSGLEVVEAVGAGGVEGGGEDGEPALPATLDTVTVTRA
jgi:peptidyl-prolyl cis-trans isomerase B (cyclophilin B)